MAEFPETIQRYDWNVAVDGRFSDPYRWRQGSNPPPQGPPGAADAAFFDTGNSEWPYTVTMDADTSVAMLAVGRDNVVLRVRGSSQVGELYAGFNGSTGRLEIRRLGVAGEIVSRWAVVGLDSGSNAYVTLNYVRWSNLHQMVVGSAASSYGEIRADGTVLPVGEGIILGQFQDSYGHVQLRGSQMSGAELLVGWQGNGSLAAEFSEIEVGWLAVGCEVTESFYPEYPSVPWGMLSLDSSRLRAYSGMSTGYHGQGRLYAYGSELSTGGPMSVGYEGPWAYGWVSMGESSLWVGGLSAEPWDLRIGGDDGAMGVMELYERSYLEVTGNLYLGTGRRESSSGGSGYLNLQDQSSMLVRGSVYIGSNLAEGAREVVGGLYVGGAGGGPDATAAGSGGGGETVGGRVTIQGNLSVGENLGDGTSYANGYLTVGEGSVVTVEGDVEVGNSLGANSRYAYGEVYVYGSQLLVGGNMRVGCDGPGGFGYISLDWGSYLEVGGNLILEGGTGQQTSSTDLNCWGASLRVGGRMYVGQQASVSLEGSSWVDIGSGLEVRGYVGLYDQSVLELHGSGLYIDPENGMFGFNGGRLQDPGPISGSVLQYDGTLAPGPVVRAVTVSGSYVMDNSTEGWPVLEMELAGASPRLYDHLVVADLLKLCGELRVYLEAGYMPSLGDRFDLLDWGSLQGAFDVITLPELTSGLLWDLSQFYSNGVIRVITPLLGDTNGDGVVDLADYNNVVNNLGASGGNVLGDTNGDGVVDLADYNNVVNNLGASLPLGGTVPEPVCLIALLPVMLVRPCRAA